MTASTKKGADPLREAVIADRDDEGVLKVWGDALLEKGDPRGELISLQLQPASLQRDALVGKHVRKHARTLLGDLAGVVMLSDHLVFDRGLLSECAIATDSRAKIAAVMGHPDWRTVRSIYFRNYSGGALSPEDEARAHPAVSLLLDDTLASLEVALGLGLTDVFAPLCASRRPLALRQVFLMNYESEDEPSATLQKQITSSSALPKLRHLGMEGMPAAWMLEAAWARKLDTLEVQVGGGLITDTLVTLEKRAPQVKTLIVRPDWVFENGFDRPEWIYRFTKVGKHFTKVEVSARDKPGDAARKRAFLSKLPKSVKVNER